MTDCPLCNRTLVKPFTLQCQHTVCHECLKIMYEISHEPQCPTCNENLPTNVISDGRYNTLVETLITDHLNKRNCERHDLHDSRESHKASQDDEYETLDENNATLSQSMYSNSVYYRQSNEINLVGSLANDANSILWAMGLAFLIYMICYWLWHRL